MSRAASYSLEYYDRFLYGITLKSRRLTDFRIKIKHYGNYYQYDDDFREKITRMGKQTHQKMKIIFV